MYIHNLIEFSGYYVEYWHMKHLGGSNCYFIFTHKSSQELTKDFQSKCLGKIREKREMSTCSVMWMWSQNRPQVRVLNAVFFGGGMLLHFLKCVSERRFFSHFYSFALCEICAVVHVHFSLTDFLQKCNESCLNAWNVDIFTWLFIVIEIHLSST